MNKKLAFVIFAFAFIVAIVAGFYSPPGEERPAPAEFRAKLRETILPPKKTPPPAKPTDTGRNPSSVKRVESLNRAAFLEKYGDKIGVSEFGNRVVRFDGISTSSDDLTSVQKVEAFRPSHSGDLIARAREILHDAWSLLGLSGETEFDEGTATPGEFTGQVVFQQTRGGVPIYPGGLVTVLMGPNGELRTLDSSVYPSVEVLNSPSLPPPEASRSVLYVTEAEPKAILRYGYETMAKGIQTVTDAQTGTVLFTRDRRIH